MEALGPFTSAFFLSLLSLSRGTSTGSVLLFKYQNESPLQCNVTIRSWVDTVIGANINACTGTEIKIKAHPPLSGKSVSGFVCVCVCERGELLVLTPSAYCQKKSVSLNSLFYSFILVDKWPQLMLTERHALSAETRGTQNTVSIVHNHHKNIGTHQVYVECVRGNAQALRCFGQAGTSLKWSVKTKPQPLWRKLVTLHLVLRLQYRMDHYNCIFQIKLLG